MPGRVDQRHAGQPAARDLDDQAVQVLGAQRAELQHGPPVDAVEPDLLRRPAVAGAPRPVRPRPFAYQVTTRVHSPASVAASRSPTKALSSVDLPALIRPAMATRSGSSQPAHHRLEPGLLGRARVGRHRVLQQRPDAGGEAARAAPLRHDAASSGRRGRCRSRGGLAEQRVDQPPRARGQVLQPLTARRPPSRAAAAGPGPPARATTSAAAPGSAPSTCAAPAACSVNTSRRCCCTRRTASRESRRARTSISSRYPATARSASARSARCCAVRAPRQRPCRSPRPAPRSAAGSPAAPNPRTRPAACTATTPTEPPRAVIIPSSTRDARVAASAVRPVSSPAAVPRRPSPLVSACAHSSQAASPNRRATSSATRSASSRTSRRWSASASFVRW